MYLNPKTMRVYVIQVRPKQGEHRVWRTMLCPINGVELFSDYQEATDIAVDMAKTDSRNGYRAQGFAMKRILGPLHDTFMECP